MAALMRLFSRLPKLKAESDDFPHLDLMRFVAASGIVVLHWRTQLVLGEGQQHIVANMRFLGSFVDLFFVISGFIIAYVYQERMNGVGQYADFMRKRFARLAPLHYLTFALYLALLLAGPAIGLAMGGDRREDLSCIVPNLTFTHAFGLCGGLSFNEPSWSISAEMGCYLVFPLFLWLVRRSPVLLAAAALGTIGVFYAISPLMPEDRYWFHWTYDYGVWRALPSFALGVAFFGLRPVIAKIPFAQGLLVANALVWLGLAIVGAPLGLLLIFMHLAVLFGLAADLRGKATAFVRKGAPLGSLTYPLYMLHGLVGMAGAFVLEKLSLPPALHNASLILLFGVAMGVSYVSLNAFERPTRRWLSGAPKPAARKAPLKPELATSEDRFSV